MTKRRIHFPLVLTIATSALLTLTCRLPSLNLPQPETSGLQSVKRAADGQVSGSFVYPQDQGDETVQFSVSPDGLAGFWIEGASEDDLLTVDVRQKGAAQMSWGGELLDGFGALSTDEENALDQLLLSDLAYGLAMIPLDIACQEDGLVDPAQLAALLYPLQMRFKYLETDRTAAASLLGSLSQCTYGDDEANADQNTSMIMMMPSSPVPVVFGYFPFDPEEAAEVSNTTSSSMKLASLNPSLSVAAMDNPLKQILPGFSPSGPDPIQNEWGPCKAKCRGACGSDCTTSNCKLTVEDRCEKNQEGVNDGFKSIVYIYDCGSHPGCVKHDACYDNCNSYYGCGTWSAAFCMHGDAIISVPFEYFAESYISCDSEVVLEEGLIDSVNWMRGAGPQITRQVFEYTDPDYSYEYDPVSCPLGESVVEEEPVIPQEEEYTIPAGTYSGKTTFQESFEGSDYSIPVCSENTVYMVVGSDGNVQGEVHTICSSTSVNDTNGDGITFHKELTGVIKGTLLDNTDEISISYTSSYYFTCPQWDSPDLGETSEFIYTYKVQVLDNGMNLTPTGDARDFYSYILYKE